MCLLLTFGFVHMIQAQSNSFQKGIFNINVGAGFPNKTHAAIDGASAIFGSDLFKVDGKDNGSSTPMFLVSGTYGLSDNVGIGIYTGYFNSSSEVVSIGNTLLNTINANSDLNILGGQSFGKTKYSVFTLGGKLEVHEQLFRNVDKLDTYASTYLGYNFVNDNFDSVEYLNADNASVSIPILGELNLNTLIGTAISNANYPTLTYEINAGAKYQIADHLSLYGEAGYGRFLLNMGMTYSIY